MYLPTPVGMVRTTAANSRDGITYLPTPVGMVRLNFSSLNSPVGTFSPRPWGWSGSSVCQICRGQGVSPHARGDGPMYVRGEAGIAAYLPTPVGMVLESQ